MKRTIVIVLVLSYGLAVASCTGKKTVGQKSHHQQNITNKKMQDPVHINAKASITTENKIIVLGKTNLPDQAKLVVTLSDKTSGFEAQAATTVLDNTFSAGPLGPDSGLSPGNYTVDISMSVPSTQPDVVQSEIGSKGEYLSGPLVKTSTWGGNWVDYSFQYRIGSRQSIEQAKLSHLALVGRVERQIQRLLKAGHFMEKYRNSESPSSRKMCGTLMREKQSKVKEVRLETAKLSSKYSGLKAATGELMLCVSCLNTALQSCRRVAGILNRPE